MILQRMVDWCPYEEARLLATFSTSAMFFRGEFKRTKSSKDHSKCHDGECFAFTVSDDETKLFTMLRALAVSSWAGMRVRLPRP